MRLGYQPLELAVLQFQFAQSFGFAGVHARVLGAPPVKQRVTEAVFAPDLVDRNARLGLPQKTNDLFFAKFACSHLHHSPG